MSNFKMTIAFYVNGMGFSGDSLNKQSLGGSETAGLCMAREMARLGHDVVMFCNTDRPGKYDGVNYLTLRDFNPYMTFTDVDVLIAQRVPQVFSNKFKSKVNILWQHDVALKRMRVEFRGVLWNLDEVWGLSKYHLDQMEDIYKAPRKLFWQTRNGIDPIKLDPAIQRHPKRLMYTARPERGLDILLYDVMPKIWKQDKDVELYVAGYDNTVPEMREYYESLYRQIQKYQQMGYKVQHLGALTKEQLYAHYQQATVYAYPTEFDEVSCITVMECMACGLPMVATACGALPETMQVEAGVMLNGKARSKEYQELFVTTVMDLIKGNNIEKYRNRGIELARELYMWSDLAVEWTEHLAGLFERKTANKETLARNFYRNEDIQPLLALEVEAWNDRIAAEYPMLGDSEAYDKHYREQGEHYAKKITDKVKIEPSTRIAVAMQMMSTPRKVLDYAGGTGNEAVQFIDRFGCEVVSTNISPDEIQAGEKFIKPLCKTPDKLTFVCEKDIKKIDGMFDVVFAGEILEHVEQPWLLIDELESKCINGGQMVFTMPFGPWGDTDEETDYRGHLWSFTRADIKEMLADKVDLKCKVVGKGFNPKNNETIGWLVISYTNKLSSPADDKVINLAKPATYPIDFERKIALQAPRQSLSACLIIGGKQEGLLHRCLASVYPVVDEIVVLDTGMSDECKRIVGSDKYKDKMVFVPDGPNPLEVGFDEARNEGIKHATGDWILWIDTDEELLYGTNIYKYLHDNIYEGYSIRQHHFSAQPPNCLKADLPIRLFRNGKGVKFFGVVHEHPETGINEGVGTSTVLSDVDIAHDGYLTEQGRRVRFMRNYDLLVRDREKYPDRLLGMFLMMRDKLHLIRYKLETNQRRLTPEVKTWCEEIIKCYQDHFLGENMMMSHDGLMYYTEALGVLGRGLEYVFQVNVAMQGVEEDPTCQRARFATPEDFMKFIKHRVDTTSEAFTGKFV